MIPILTTLGSRASVVTVERASARDSYGKDSEHDKGETLVPR